MKLAFLMVGLCLSSVLNASTQGACESAGEKACKPVGIVRVYMLETALYSGDTTISDCSNLSDSLAAVTTALFTLGEPYAKSARDFTTLLLSSKGVLLTADNQELHISPKSIKFQQLNYLDIEANDWEQNPTLEGRDTSQVIEQANCYLTDNVKYFSFDLVLSVDGNLTQWISQEASDNQRGYDNESSPFFKVLYGKDGLGYGNYVRGGIHYKNTPRLFGVEWSYDEFSLIWALAPENLSSRINELIPVDITSELNDKWLGNCQTINMRVASDSEFVTPSKTITTKIAQCDQKPLFTNFDTDPVFDNTTPEFEQYLDNKIRLHHLMFLTNDQGKIIPCEERDLISFNGCSQPVVYRVEPFLKAFLREEFDLFVEIVLPQWKNQRYRIDRFTGQVELLPPPLL